MSHPDPGLVSTWTGRLFIRPIARAAKQHISTVVCLIVALGISHAAVAQSVLDKPPTIEFQEWVPLEPISNTRRFSAQFPSPAPSGHAENDQVQLEVYLPAQTEGPIPAVVLLHYWGASDHRVESSLAADLARRGMAGIILSLPFHMERTPAGVRSGELAISSDPAKLIRTMTQSILDLKRVVDWIQSRAEFQHDRIGISGSSLGALVASLAVGVDQRFTDAAFVVGGVDLAHVIWHSSRVVRERDELRRAGYTESSLAAALESIEPRKFLHRSRLKNAYVIGAKFDTVIPTASTQRLIDGLNSPAVHWLETGHYGGFFVQKRIQNSVGLFFDAAFANKAYTPPTNLNAPTIRLAVAYEPREGPQVGAGIDFLRPNRPRDPFATLFISPRGLKGILGVTLDKGYSIGVFGQKGGISLGLMWSMVL